MKFTKYFMPFAALALLASCSNDNLDAPVAPEGPNAEGTGASCINISISMPGTGSRSVTLANGEENEYAVNDATLYFYNPSTTGDASTPGTYAFKIVLDQYFANSPANPEESEITISHSVKQIKLDNEKFDKSKEYYVLAVINGGGLSTLPDNETTNTWDAWYKVAQTGKMVSGKYFTMTNALGWQMSTSGSYDEAPTWLTKVGPSNYYYDNDPNPSTNNLVNIYVQRGVAKITLANESSVKVGTLTDVKKYVEETIEEGSQADPEYNPWQSSGDKVILTSWTVDVTNKTTYPVQMYQEFSNGNLAATQWINNGGITHTDNWGDDSWTAPLDRFFGGENKFRRLYWAIDPNYSSHTTASDFDVVTTATWPTLAPTSYKDENNKQIAFYPLENTFAVSEMIQEASTRVLFKGKYFVGGKTATGDEVSETNATTVDAPDFISYNGKVSAIPEGLTINTDYVSGENPKNSGTISQLFEARPSDETAQKKYDEALKTLCTNLGLSTSNTQDLNYHEGGVVYYSIIVRHFDDTELGLATGALGTSLKYSASTGLALLGDKYPTDKDTYLLGRYGVVRNNWYDLGINKITGPGTPDVPTPDDTPDDDPSNLVMDVDIHILSWAKRGHNYDL